MPRFGSAARDAYGIELSMGVVKLETVQLGGISQGDKRREYDYRFSVRIEKTGARTLPITV